MSDNTILAVDLERLIRGGTACQLRAQAETLLQVGVHVPPDSLHNSLGKRVEHLVAHWFRYYAWSGASLMEVADAYERKFTTLAREAGPASATLSALTTLSQDEGQEVVLLSTWRRQIVLDLLDSFAEEQGLEKRFLVDTLFTQILCDDEHNCYKPGTETLEALAEQAHARPHEIAILESSPLGVEAARRFGGCLLADVRDAFSSPPELERTSQFPFTP